MPMPPRLALLSFVSATLLIIAASTAAAAKRAFVVEDAIELRRVVLGEPFFSQRGRLKASPDRKRFFIVTQQGRLETNENVYELIGFTVGAENSSAVTSKQLVKFSSTSNDPGIADASWSGNDEITFLGVQASTRPQVYSVNVLTGRLRQRTVAAAGVRMFAVNEASDLVYVTQDEPDARVVSDALGSGFVLGKDHYPWAVMREDWPRVFPAPPAQMLLQDRSMQGTAARRFGPAVNEFGNRFLWLSPDGTKVVTEPKVARIPDAWRRYTSAFLKVRIGEIDEILARDAAPLGYALNQFMVIDTKTGAANPLVDSPKGDHSFPHAQVLAVPGRNAVVATNLMLPIDYPTRLPVEEVRRHPMVAEIDLDSERITPILLLEDSTGIVSMEWVDEEILEIGRVNADYGPGIVQRFRKSGHQWNRLRDRTSPLSDTTLLLSGRYGASRMERFDRPPEIVITDLSTAKTVYQYRLNPQLDEIALGATRMIRWQDEDGDDWQGILVLPPDYSSGRAYPLIIQTRAARPDEYLADGAASFPGFSARALAARGFVVVEEPAPYERTRAWAQMGAPEGEKALTRFRALINKLTGDGIIDPARVGLIGFSRSCYWVKYALTRADFPIAAAYLTDGLDFSYVQAMMFGASNIGVSMHAVYGAPPIGQGLQKWLRDAPGFNAHKIKAPVHISAITSPGLAAEMEMYTALRLQNVPTEMSYFPAGTHILVRPRERLRSQEASVDWFDFWLNGREDQDAQKRSQYARWRKMREDWREKQVGEAHASP